MTSSGSSRCVAAARTIRSHPRRSSALRTSSRTESIGGYINVIPKNAPRVLSLMLLGGKHHENARRPQIGAYTAFQYATTMRYDLLERLGVNEMVSDRTR